MNCVIFNEKCIRPLPKSALVHLQIIAPVSTTDTAIQKKIFGSGMTALIISNREMEDIMKIFKSLEKFGLLIKCVSETIKNETK